MARNMKNVWYLYQATRLCTNANAAGNPMTITITFATAQVVLINQAMSRQTCAGGTHTLTIKIYDEDDVLMAQLASGGAGSTSNYCFIPSIGSAATASANYNDTTRCYIGAGQKLKFETGAASANTGDTLLVGVALLMSTPGLPTWAATGTDSVNFTFAASTISTANTLQAVVL